MYETVILHRCCALSRMKLVRAPVAVRICEPQCITSLSGCLRVQIRMSTAPVYGCHISTLLCIYVCKIIGFVKFQDWRDIYLFSLEFKSRQHPDFSNFKPNDIFRFEQTGVYLWSGHYRWRCYNGSIKLLYIL